MEQELSFCTTADGVRVAIARCSSGPPLVYVPGWPGHVQQEWTQPFARRFLTRLSRGVHLVRYDMRGSGLSDRDAEPASIDVLVDDLESVLDRLVLPRVTLLSLGMVAGPTVVEYSRRHPERVEAVVLASSFLDGSALMSDEERDSLVGYVERFGYPHFRVVDHPDVSIDDQRGVHQLQEESCTPALQAAVLRIMFGVTLESTAAEVMTRAMVLHDRRDPIVPFEQGRQLAAAMPNATFMPYDAGTSAPWAIADILVPAIAGFMGHGNTRTGGATTKLTCREQDVLRGVTAGQSNRDIASALHLSEKTVKTHVSNVLRKLGVDGRTEAAVIAVAEGLIET